MSSAVKTELETAIHWMRGQRVMFDFDLAEIYGVTTKRLVEQFKRNLKRFPSDFAYQLTAKEFAILRSQFATSSSSVKTPDQPEHGGRRTRPFAFTEHGAIMLASVLNSDTAIAASVEVVRAFVQLRQAASASIELATKLAEIDTRIDGHDTDLSTLFAALRRLLEPPATEKPQIGFRIREEAPATLTFNSPLL